MKRRLSTPRPPAAAGPTPVFGPEQQDLFFTQLAAIGHALSSAPRLRLLHLLSQGPKAVEALAQQTRQSIANTSAHLKVLRAAHLVEARKQGRYVFYRLAGEAVSRFYLALRGLGQEQAPAIRELERIYLDDPRRLSPLTQDELAEEVRQGRVLLLDVRPADEYAAGHLPGAISAPYPQWEAALERLSRRKPIVAYCRGPYCVTAVEAVGKLLEKGYQVRRLPWGTAEWRAAGRKLQE